MTWSLFGSYLIVAIFLACMVEIVIQLSRIVDAIKGCCVPKGKSLDELVDEEINAISPR